MPDNEPAPAPQPAAAIAPQPPAAPIVHQTVTIPLEQLQAFTAVQARLATLEAEQRTHETSAAQEQAHILAEKGEIQNALKLVREQSQAELAAERGKAAAIEERAKRYALDGELSRALSHQPLVPGGAEQLARLFRGEFLVDAQGDSFTVRTPTFQTPGDFVKDQLARSEFAHFVRAQGQGGTAGNSPASQSTPTPPANPSEPPQPKTLGEAVILQMKSIEKNKSNPQTDMASGFGLRALNR